MSAAATVSSPPVALAPERRRCRRRSASTGSWAASATARPRGLPLPRRLPGPQRRHQAGPRRLTGDPMDGRYSERFFAAEAALVGRLNHPNVVQIFDAVPDPVAPYLVMEYVAGSTLRPYCRADQLLSLELIVEIGFKCAMALGYVYRQGLIHRDVKPANLLAVLHNGADHRRQGHRLRQRAEPRLGRDADLPGRIARLHVARAARRRHHRLPRRHVLAGRRALPPDCRPAAVRRAGAVGHDASDLQRQAGTAGRPARRRQRRSRRHDPEAR